MWYHVHCTLLDTPTLNHNHKIDLASFESTQHNLFRLDHVESTQHNGVQRRGHKLAHSAGNDTRQNNSTPFFKKKRKKEKKLLLSHMVLPYDIMGLETEPWEK